ncbi:MAG TPA: hypothetical protein PLB89_05315 [Flavobacteriales bacterium]|nr:hypothetical protein [Flavobacteriales bacterium]
MMILVALICFFPVVFYWVKEHTSHKVMLEALQTSVHSERTYYARFQWRKWRTLKWLFLVAGTIAFADILYGYLTHLQ